MTHPAALAAPLRLPRLRLANRLVRAATYEGMGTPDGAPTEALQGLYAQLLATGVGTLETSFLYISPEGRAAQPAQCGMATEAQAEAWRPVLGALHRQFPSARLVAQLAHCGRQTLSAVTRCEAVGAGPAPCTYFRERVRPLDTEEVWGRVEQFGQAAERAARAGFDGVEIHAAHGYLAHQFLSPWTNRRSDLWGELPRFVSEVVLGVRRRCGDELPVWVKLSCREERRPGITPAQVVRTAQALEKAGADAVEISCGTMEWPMGIFRGGCPVRAALRVSRNLRRLGPFARLSWTLQRLLPHLAGRHRFQPNYNAAAAALIRPYTALAVIPVGGIRSAAGATDCLDRQGLHAVALCRPLIHDAGFATRLLRGEPAESGCVHCNLCAVFADSTKPLRCYRRLTREARP